MSHVGGAKAMQLPHVWADALKAVGERGLPRAFGGWCTSEELAASRLIANYPRYFVSDTL